MDGGFGVQRSDSPPLVHGVARLTGLLFAGHSPRDALALIGPEPACRRGRAGWLMDRSWLARLERRPEVADGLQHAALALSRVFRVRGNQDGPRLLAFAAPGDLMVNAPLDFITGPAGLRLDIAFVDALAGLPPLLPGHCVAMNAISESAPDYLVMLGRQLRCWPGPVLNDPAHVLPMSRDWLPGLSGHGLYVPPARTISRAQLAARPPDGPVLLRPLGSHGGQGLQRAGTAAEVARFLAATPGDAFTLTRFVDYRGGDGWFRKYRIAFVGGAPFICHMAASEHWMVHYLNAGMADDPAKRLAEAAAMQGHDGFLHRHAAALARLAQRIGLDYFSIDCADAPDGRLLLFEADTAAIIHSMDPPELYPYKRPAMQRCYDAFAAMVRLTAGLPQHG